MQVPGNFPDGDEQTLATIRTPEAVSWRDLPLPRGANAVTRALQAFQGAVLIVEAGNDAVIPHQTIVNLRDSVASDRAEVVLVPDAPHVFYLDPISALVVDTVVASWLFGRMGLLLATSPARILRPFAPYA
jgi:pimeloyl-ACP methyl ester carboxylesterase